MYPCEYHAPINLLALSDKLSIEKPSSYVFGILTFPEYKSFVFIKISKVIIAVHIIHIRVTPNVNIVRISLFIGMSPFLNSDSVFLLVH